MRDKRSVPILERADTTTVDQQRQRHTKRLGLPWDGRFGSTFRRQLRCQCGWAVRYRDTAIGKTRAYAAYAEHREGMN